MSQSYGFYPLDSSNKGIHLRNILDFCAKEYSRKSPSEGGSQKKSFFSLKSEVINKLFIYFVPDLKREEMNSFWYTLGKILNGAWFYDNIGDIFNYSVIVLGFFGLFYWLRWQKKFNDQAANDPNQIK